MKLFNTLAKKIVAGVAIVAAVAGITGVAIASFGPDRPTKAYYDGVAGFDYPVFNSFTNVPNYGDERNFLTGKYANTSVLADPLSNVKQDDEITLQVLVHNNADPKYNADGSGFAKDTMVRIALPNGIAKSQQATAYINASNTTPRQVYDTMDFGSYNGGYFAVEYIPGSAHIRGNYIDTDLGANGDAIVAGGVKIGTRALNGTIEGCFKEEVLVTIKVKVKMPQYTLKKEVRKESEATTAYATTKDASLSDTLVWKMTFENIGRTKLDNVQFTDPLPDHMSVVPGSIKVYNSANPNGYTPDSAIQMNGRQIEMVLGDYAPAGNAYIYFRTKTDRNVADLCGTVGQKNTAYVQPTGLIAISNDATVNIVTGKTCQPVVVKECKSLEFAKINRTTFDFTATANVANAHVTSYVFTAKDKNGASIATQTVTTNATTAAYHFVKDVPGDYTVSVVINTDKGVATGTCEKTVTVEQVPTTPVFTCDGLTIEKIGGRKVKVSVSYTADPSSRVQVRTYEYNFGDGSTAQVTNKNPNEYEYAKDGTYNVNVKVTFAVDGVNQTISGSNCAKTVTFTTKEVCKYNSTIDADNVNCKVPTALPRTGGSATLGMFIVTTMLGMFAFRAYAVRKN